jgi:hypothetical protein
MTTRTFIQKGQGYGQQPVNIVAKINGTTVYSGAVPTSAEDPPPLPDPAIDLGEEIFRFTNTVDFAGPMYCEISIQANDDENSFLYITDTLANYIRIPNPDPEAIPPYVPGGPDTFGYFFSEEQTDSQGIWISGDPQTAVTIDEVPAEPHPVRTYPGQYYWVIYPGQIFTCTINIQAGIEPTNT